MLWEDIAKRFAGSRVGSSENMREARAAQNVWWYIAIATAEVLGTGMLVFMGCASAVPGLGGDAPSLMKICIVFGFAVAIIIQMFAHVSGAHLNPAVSVAACVFKLIPVPVAALYSVAQIVGAILGYASILMITPTESLYHDKSNMNVTHGFCTTVPNGQVSTLQALIAEYLATSILIFTCCGVWDKRNATKHDSVPIKFGMAITGLALALGPYTGASMNPARSFAPALFTGVWDSHWIYWLSPLTAGLVVSYFYKFVFERQPPPAPESDQSDVPLNRINSKGGNVDKASGESRTSV